MVTQYARQCVTINNTMNNDYNTLQCTMTYKDNVIQNDTIYNEVQYTILPILYNIQWKTIYNDIKYDTIYNKIQYTIEYNIGYDTMDNENNKIQ